MDQQTLARALTGLPLGGLRYFERIDSTNSEAARWVEAGAPDLALAVAGEQTAGRGRLGRRWLTPPGSALAFSLVLRSQAAGGSQPGKYFARLTGLGALAVCTALEALYALPARIKWPNDVLGGGLKLAGVLVEASWKGDRPQAAILGIGVNVAPASVPPPEGLNFPATCVEAAVARAAAEQGRPIPPVDRLDLLRSILAALLDWRPRLSDAAFLDAWEARLAYRGEWVTVSQAVGAAGAGVSAETQEGRVLGLADDGALRLARRSGEEFNVYSGEIRLRPGVG